MEVNMTFRRVPVVEYGETSGEWGFQVFAGILTDSGEEQVVELQDLVMETAGATSLQEATAVAIELIRSQIDDEAVEETVHCVNGSVELFTELFGGAFDLTAGDPALGYVDPASIEHR